MSYSNITITTEINLSFETGEFIQVIHDSNNYIYGQVVSYNPSTGVMVFTPIRFAGSGSFNTWTIVASGVPGLDGTSGTSGTSGISGSSGTSGGTGTAGSSGTSGTSGINGSSGTSGGTGTAGSSGTSGSSGQAGSSGTSGITPNPNARVETTFTATAGQTVFTVTYTVGQVDVYYNGSKLAPSEFTAINGTSITLAVPCQVNDIVDVVAYVTGVAGTSGTSGISGTGTNGSSGTSGTSATSGTSGTSGTSFSISGTTGNVVYFNSSTTISGSNNHYWDNTNNWLGIGTNTPSAGVTSYSTSAATQFKSAGTAPAMTFSNTLTSPTLAAVFGLATGSGQFVTGTASGDFAIANQSATPGAIVFGTGTAEKMRLASNGNIGMGTSSPSYKLSVVGPNGGTAISWTDAANNTGYLSIRASAAAIGADNNLVFETAASEKMRITTAGNVGIGTSSPNKNSVGRALTVNASSGNSMYELTTADSSTTAYWEYTGTDSSIINVANGYLRLGTNNSERMRITSGGNVGIGISSPSDKLSVSAGSPSISIRYTSAGSVGSPNYSYLYFRDFTGSGNVRGGIYFQDQSFDTSGTNMLLRVMNNSDTIITSINMQRDGNVYNYNNSAVWAVASDIRVKQNIRPINNALDKLCSLNPSHFEYKNNLGKIKTGFIAQEFEQVFLGHVSELEPTEEYAKYFENGEKMKTIDADLIPYLVKAIQELKAEIDQLKNK